MTLAQELGITRDQAEALIGRAFDLVDASDLDGAAELFTGLLMLNPGDAAVHAALGAVLHQQGKLQAAEQAYDEALRLDEAALLARVNRGDLRLRRGDQSGRVDLEFAAARASPVQERAKVLLRFYAP